MMRPTALLDHPPCHPCHLDRVAWLCQAQMNQQAKPKKGNTYYLLKEATQ
jgi:hypothetical protein